MTGEMFGSKWKIKIDSYLKGKAIVDLKVMKSLKEHFWIRDSGYMDFIQYWGLRFARSYLSRGCVSKHWRKTSVFYSCSI